MAGLFAEMNDHDALIDGQDQRPHIWPSADPFLIYPAGSSFSLMCKTGALAAHQWNVNWRLPSSYDKEDYEHAKVRWKKKNYRFSNDF